MKNKREDDFSILEETRKAFDKVSGCEIEKEIKKALKRIRKEKQNN